LLLYDGETNKLKISPCRAVPFTRLAVKNLDKRIREETGLPVSIADDPLASVVLGTGKMLSDFRLLRQVCID